jgi:hypothetical protein
MFPSGRHCHSLQGLGLHPLGHPDLRQGRVSVRIFEHVAVQCEPVGLAFFITFCRCGNAPDACKLLNHQSFKAETGY